MFLVILRLVLSVNSFLTCRVVLVLPRLLMLIVIIFCLLACIVYLLLILLPPLLVHVVVFDSPSCFYSF